MVLRAFLISILLSLGFILIFTDWKAWVHHFETGMPLQLQKKANQDNIPRTLPNRLKSLKRSKPPKFSKLFFPDPKFRACLEATGKRRPELITHLDCRDQSIKEVIGIEKLVNLKVVNLSSNDIQSISLLPSQRLRSLDISHNNFDLLKFNTSSMEALNISHNQIRRLKLDNFPKLKNLIARNNRLMTLTIAAPNLETLDVTDNQIQELNISNGNKIKTLRLSKNRLVEFNFNHLERLKYIDLRNNKLKKLVNIDVEQPLRLFISGNGLFSQRGGFDLILKNGQVINQEPSEAEFKDPVLRDCVALTRKKSLQDIESLNCFTAAHYFHHNAKIKDVSGLEQLKSLKRLSLKNQRISTVDLTPLGQLKFVDLSGNLLSEIDLRKNPLIEEAILSDNEIKQFNADNERLKRLNISNNNIQNLDLSKVINLRSLQVNNNQLKNIDVSALIKLRQLEVAGNQLTDIALDKIPYLKSLKLAHNPWDQKAYGYFKQRFYKSASALDDSMFKGQFIYVVSYNADAKTFPDPVLRECITKHVRNAKENRATALRSLSCRSRLINDITGLEELSQLKQLTLFASKINQINLKQFKYLESLTLRNNKIKHLDLRGTPSLKILEVKNSQLEKITFDESHDLIYIDIQNNQLKNLTIHSMPSLTKLFANDNQINQFSHGDFSEMTHLKLSNNSLATLDTGSFEKLKYLYLDKNNIANIDLDPLENLETLVINDNFLKHVGLSKLKALKGAYLFNNHELLPELTNVDLEHIRVDSFQFEHMRKTGQLSEYEHIDNYQTNRYFLKRNRE